MYYIQTDHLNTPRLITDQSNNVVWQWKNEDPFGNNIPVANNGFEFNLRFPGQYADRETGLHYNGQRYYDPLPGRYTTSDRLGLAGGSLSTYTYADNDPLSKIDPTGEFAIALPWVIPPAIEAITYAATAVGAAWAAHTVTKAKEQCDDDDSDDCKQKATDWELKQAGIDAHEVKKGLGQVSLYEICKCKKGGFAVKRKGCQGPIIYRL